MFFLGLLPKLLIAGGSSFLGTLQLPPSEVINNHTLAGEKIPSTKVVCRDRWGTPMLPDGKAGYNLIAPIKKGLIAQSLWIPPVYARKPVKTPPAVEATVTSPATTPSTNAPSSTVPAGAPAALPADAAAAVPSTPSGPSPAEPSPATALSGPAVPASAPETAAPSGSPAGIPAQGGGEAAPSTPSPAPVAVP